MTNREQTNIWQTSTHDTRSPSNYNLQFIIDTKNIVAQSLRSANEDHDKEWQHPESIESTQGFHIINYQIKTKKSSNSTKWVQSLNKNDFTDTKNKTTMLVHHALFSSK